MRNLVIVTTLLVLVVGSSQAQELQTTAPDGVPIHYDVAGGGPTAIVLVHGWSCDRTYWSAQVPVLAEAYTVVTVDLAGHGDSGTGRDVWSMARFGGDVVAVVRALNLDRVVLVGHSMGGPVTVEAARHLGDRVLGIVGVDTFHDMAFRPSREWTAETLTPLNQDFRATMQSYVRSFFVPTSDPDLVDRIVQDMAAGPEHVIRNAAEEYYRWWREESDATFAALRAPLFLINAQSPATRMETARTFAADLDVEIIPGVGHFVMIEAPDRFNDALAGAIDRFSSGAGAAAGHRDVGGALWMVNLQRDLR